MLLEINELKACLREGLRVEPAASRSRVRPYPHCEFAAMNTSSQVVEHCLLRQFLALDLAIWDPGGAWSCRQSGSRPPPGDLPDLYKFEA